MNSMENHEMMSAVGAPDKRAQSRSLARAAGSDAFEIQFLTSSGWQTDRTLDSESLAIAHFFAIGKANVWTGHVRIQHDGRTIKSTLHPNKVDNTSCKP